jgi:hypothetical protein
MLTVLSDCLFSIHKALSLAVSLKLYFYNSYVFLGVSDPFVTRPELNEIFTLWPETRPVTLRWGRHMLLTLCIAGTTGLILGTFAAAFADVFPAHRAALQEWGGGLLVASVAILGLGFPLM